MMEYILETKDLTVGYGSPLIKNIRIRLQPGHILTIIGPNGAGKSTILKTLTRYLRPIAGAVYIGGGPVEDYSGRDFARQVSVVLTQRLRTELMTCEDVVATGRYPYTGSLGILSEEDRLQVEEAMRTVHVTELRSKDFTKISDGQRQRVLLARAICQQPRIIVLDEPTSFLDIHYEVELLDILRRMAKERGIAVVMSLHELDLAERASDEVLCVDGSEIRHYGPAREVFREDLISSLYGLREGSYNELFGCVELPRPQGEIKTFVLAGGGTGIPVFRALQKRQIPFACGVLHENDVDFPVAKALAGALVTEKSFRPISDESWARAAELLGDCETLIDCAPPTGPGNERNASLREEAERRGLRIVSSREYMEE